MKIKENHAADEHKAGLTFSFFQKKKAGDALTNKIPVNGTTGSDITENEVSESKIIGNRALESETFLPNFRQGDAIILMNGIAMQIMSPIKWFSKVILNT